jgi:hypothetical protein
VLCPTPFYQISKDLVRVKSSSVKDQAWAHSVFFDAFKSSYHYDTENWKLHCWSWYTKSNCPGFPRDIPHSSTNQGTSYLSKIGGTRMFMRSDTVLECFNVPDMTPCGAGW